MDNQDNINLINQYISGDLDEKALLAFQERVNQDVEFAEEVQIAVMINAQHQVEQKKRWERLLQQKHKEKRESKIKRLHPSTLFRNIRNIAAILLIGVIGLVIYNTFNSGVDINQLADQQLEIIHPSPTVTMGNEKISQNWKTAIRAYQEKKFALAVPVLERLTLQNPNDGEAHFYLALCYLYQDVDAYQKAIDSFDKSKKINAPRYNEKTNWYQSLAYIKLGQTEKAKLHLEKIVKQKSWQHKSAQILLEGIKKG